MKPKKLITWAVFAFVGYLIFGYVKDHTSPQVIAYKRFARAVLDDDSFVARDRSVEGYGTEVLANRDQLDALFENRDIVFTYYVIKSVTVDADGKSASVVAEQVSRVNTEDVSKFWGYEEIRIQHIVRVVKMKDVWLVANFGSPGIN